MLRSLFGEAPRKDDGLLLEAMQAIDELGSRVQQLMLRSNDPRHMFRELDVWVRGLRVSLDELEQSIYCSNRFGAMITKPSVADMSDDEKLNYYRHVYFFKNAIIRVFSILDKLGVILNELFDLRTEKVKSRFSYFTVLRHMRSTSVHDKLEARLTELKTQYRTEMTKLRNMRNMEIHHMNAEMRDDLEQSHRDLGVQAKLENIADNTKELQSGYDMVCRTIATACQYCRTQL